MGDAEAIAESPYPREGYAPEWLAVSLHFVTDPWTCRVFPFRCICLDDTAKSSTVPPPQLDMGPASDWLL